MLSDVAQVLFRPFEHFGRRIEAFLFRAFERVRHVDAQIRPRLAVPPPESESAVGTLHPLNRLPSRYTAATSSSAFGNPLASNAPSTSRNAAIASTRDEICSAHSYGY